MTVRPRTIQIFLPSGDPRGIRVSELTSSIARVIDVPRALLGAYLEMPEAGQVGIYFLIGDDDEQDYPSLYIGQTGSTGKRLLEHHKEGKKEWSRALVAVSLTNNLTQTHALYLEWLSIQRANEVGRYKVENGNSGSKPYAPAPLEADCQELFDIVGTLVATLGQPIFEPLSKPSSGGKDPELFYLRSNGYEAVGQYTEEGMVVLEGSKARKDIVPSMAQYAARRENLVAEGLLKLEGEHYVFQKNVAFKAPSGASDAVTGASTNGWLTWKTSDGRTLDEIKRKPLSVADPA